MEAYRRTEIIRQKNLLNSFLVDLWFGNALARMFLLGNAYGQSLTNK